MPYSLDEGRHVLSSWVKQNHTQLERVLDVGPGAGTYADFLRELKPTPALTIHAVEIFEPYVEQFNLLSKYNEVFINDFIDFAELSDVTYDLVILGDVIEHFPEDLVDRVWDGARKMAGPDGIVFLSTPIVDYPQGASFGNEHEAHLSQFTLDRLDALPGVFNTWGGEVIGVALANGN